MKFVTKQLPSIIMLAVIVLSPWWLKTWFHVDLEAMSHLRAFLIICAVAVGAFIVFIVPIMVGMWRHGRK